MKPKQNELGQIIIDINLANTKSRAQKPLNSLYDILKAEPALPEDPDISDNIDDEKSKRHSAVLRKTLRFCMKQLDIDLEDIPSSIDISKNKIINFLKNRNKNLLSIDEKRRLREFMQKQLVRLLDGT